MKKDKDFEKLIEVQKMKRFSMARALTFWDNFDVELYRKILIKKKKMRELNYIDETIEAEKIKNAKGGLFI